MPESPIGKLRHRRATILRRIAPLERKLILQRARLALVEAAILQLWPTLDMPLPQRKLPQVFAKGELTRMALDMLRRAGRPMAMGEMVRGCLAVKGLRFPDRQRRSATERHLQNAFARFEARGLTKRVGRGRQTLRALVER
jgi:hypothetical protein